ncbi:MAG: hypothetical protein HY900_17645 [Deltaproteobacteria bacterium]|nr:hypothetical protein [Deltaproteobacteria bacterium]
MPERDGALRRIETLLASPRTEEVREGLELLRAELGRGPGERGRALVEVLSTLFYVDPFDRPDLARAVEEAVRLLACCPWAMPLLLETLDAGDLKAQMAVASALGSMGEDAVEPLLAEYRRSSDASRKAFVLYALGKVKAPAVVKASECAVEACASSDRELRDTATRIIGKLAESIRPADLPEALGRSFVAALRANLGDSSPAVRAKAVRSLGKLGKFGHLRPEERQELRAVCERLLGRDEQSDWERAYIVRREAVEALRQL